MSLSDNLQYADPESITLSFTFAGGSLRLWKPGKDAGEVRELSTDAVVSGATIQVSDIGLTPGGTATFYVEAMDASGLASGIPIQVSAAVDGDAWSGTLVDTVHVRPIEVDLVAHRTGAKLGEAVAEVDEDSDDPSRYLVLTNNDFEQGLSDARRDFDDDHAVLPPTAGASGEVDDDLAKITLRQLPQYATGHVRIELSNEQAVRLFAADGTELTELTLDLAAPTGPLAGLLTGDVDVWLEGLEIDTDFTFSFVLSESAGGSSSTEISRDEVHLTLAEWNFRDGNGNSVVYLPRVATETLQYVAENAHYFPSTTIGDLDRFVTLELDGLASFASGTVTVTSDSSGSESVEDELESSGGMTKSRRKIGLYSSDGNDVRLTESQRETLQDIFEINVVHNPEARVRLQGMWDDQLRNMKVAPELETTLDKQVVRVGDNVLVSTSLVNPDPNLRYKTNIVVAGALAVREGPQAVVQITPSEAGIAAILIQIDVLDAQGNLIGRFADTRGKMMHVLPVGTSDATLGWTRTAFDALRVGGDSVPWFPDTPHAAFSTEQFFDLNNRISRAYAAMYTKDPDAYKFCGLAANTSKLGGQGLAAAGIMDDVFRGLKLAPDAVAQKQMYEAFITLNWQIFADTYRQFVAFDSGGLNAVQVMFNEGVIRQGQLDAWTQIAAGRQAKAAGNAALAGQEFWEGNLKLVDVEQNLVAQATYDHFKPLFLFLSNQQWFKTQLKSSVPGSGPNNAFSAVVPNGVNGGQANVGVKEDRWQWITSANVGIWDTYRAWAPAHQAIAPADVTNAGLQIPLPLPRLQDIVALINWRPPA